jgi:hypothetical protein
MQLHAKHFLTALLALSLVAPAQAKGDHKHEEVTPLLSSRNALYVMVGVPFLHSLYVFLNTEHDGKPARHSFKNLMTAIKKCIRDKNKKSAAQSVIQELKYFYFDGLCKPNKSKKSTEHKHAHDSEDHGTCDHEHSDADVKDTSDDSSVSVYGWVQKKGKPFLLPVIITAKIIDEGRLLDALANRKISLLQFFTESVGIGGDPLKVHKSPSCC